jgi:hypothetical protein
VKYWTIFYSPKTAYQGGEPLQQFTAISQVADDELYQFVDGKLAQNLHAEAVLVNRNGEIPHLSELGYNWQSQIHVVASLHDVLL